jgi:putative transcription factor
MAKKLEEGDIEKISYVDYNVSMAIQQARQDHKLTQAQLAKLINEKATLIEAYEKGSAIPDNGVIARMEKAMECKLPRQKKEKKKKAKAKDGDDW